MSILLAAAVLALIALTVSNVYAVRAFVSYRIDRAQTSPTPIPDRHLDDSHETELLTLNKRVDDLTLAVDEGIKRVDRAESRIQKTVTSARRLVREAGLEHAGIEAEYEELQPPNAEGIEPLSPMPAPVEETRVVRFPGGSLEIGAA